MLGRLSHTNLLRYAGIYTWALVGLPIILNIWFLPPSRGVDGNGVHVPMTALTYFGFGICYWLATSSLAERRREAALHMVLLLAMNAAAIGVGFYTQTGLGAVLLMIMAGVLPWLAGIRGAVFWLVAAHVALVPSFMARDDFNFWESLLQSLFYVGFSAFVLTTGYVAKQQAEARDEQRRLNAELRATRALLAESARVNERTRISRELHDLLGHHLTALSLNPEVASHMTEGRAQEHVRQGQYPGPPAADRRARGGQPAARRQRWHRPVGCAAPAGRPRAVAGRHPGRRIAVGHRRSRAGPRHAALYAGNHHQCGAPRRRAAPGDPGLARGRRGGAGGQRRRPRAPMAWCPATACAACANGSSSAAVLSTSRPGAGPVSGCACPSPSPPRPIRPSKERFHDPSLPWSTTRPQSRPPGIRSLLALDGGIEVVAEAGDGRQAVELIPQVRPDVVLMDMRMPAMSGLEALQVLSRQEQLPPTIILTTFDDDQLVLAGLKAGAKGYLLKDVSLEQLVGAIRTVADGGSLVQPAVTQRLLSGLEHMRNDFVSLDRPDPLTDRETEILRLMASGFSNKEIANSLGVAEGTIKNHVSNILSKLGVRDRTRAVLKAFELQLV